MSGKLGKFSQLYVVIAFGVIYFFIKQNIKHSDVYSLK